MPLSWFSIFINSWYQLQFIVLMRSIELRWCMRIMCNFTNFSLHGSTWFHFDGFFYFWLVYSLLILSLQETAAQHKSHFQSNFTFFVVYIFLHYFFLSFFLSIKLILVHLLCMQSVFCWNGIYWRYTLYPFVSYWF